MHADRHPEGRWACRGFQPADAPHRLLHPPRGVDGTLGVGLAGEPHQHGVTAPLDQLTAVGVRDRQQLGEGYVEEAGELLCSRLAARSESLGEAGEPGDVDECQGALEHAYSLVRRLRQPGHRERVRGDPREPGPSRRRRCRAAGIGSASRHPRGTVSAAASPVAGRKGGPYRTVRICGSPGARLPPAPAFAPERSGLMAVDRSGYRVRGREIGVFPHWRVRANFMKSALARLMC